MSVSVFLRTRLGTKTKLKDMTLGYIMRLSRIPPNEQRIIKVEMENITDDVAKYVKSYIVARNQRDCIRAFSVALVIGLSKYGNGQLSYPYNDQVSPHDLAIKHVYEKIKEKV